MLCRYSVTAWFRLRNYGRDMTFKRRPWLARASRLVDELEVCDPRFRPTNFWRPGVAQLMSDFDVRKLREFKSWPSSSAWFYPKYGQGFGNQVIGEVLELARSRGVAASDPWLTGALGGGLDARRDFDAIRLAWDQDNWPFDIEGFGESRYGRPPQRYRLGERSDVAWGRPYLNYLLCLAGLSSHVECPPRRVLELGGGFGVLGEMLHQRDPWTQYVNVDIPPLVVIAEAYLSRLLGRDLVVNEESYLPVADQSNWAAASLPSWRFPDVVGPFDVFVNSYSFQEMEPEVMARYATLWSPASTPSMSCP